MRKVAGTLLGKSVAGATRLAGRGGGQALPGKIIERLIPGYLPKMLGQLPEGVVIITGTNGKTTTTKMVVELLEAGGKKVLTNPTGSNLTRGIISSVVGKAGKSGKLDYDIAVFELDEAWAPDFVKSVRPHWVLGLNASRDQLDRYGEVDKVADLIGQTMAAAGAGVVVNADDKRLAKLASGLAVPVHFFGVAPVLLKFFPRDDELVAVGASATPVSSASRTLDVELAAFAGNHADYIINNSRYETRLELTGQHNFQNAAAALALARQLAPEIPIEKLLESLAKVTPAFGRGQVFKLANGSSVQLALVKNPASFRQGLASYLAPGKKVLIAVNDQIADGRDMSWLWDVDFAELASREITTSGVRAADMALRLSYDEIPVKTIEPKLEKALGIIAKDSRDTIIFATYTAMMKLYKLLNSRGAR